ncbi:DUF4336 domain-containing protein [Salinivibrio sp. ML290]|uniref:DUF4336 domain-containing protein n=1 Tax=Salinivibrio sp. ML290 TaxID=1909468 RepID=UPI0009887271|nr:DUF4336 domain-containing protein [Salinivibrio sp. ML290]OOE75958.1 hypothetical protein BZG23_04555 [Salinivibrio sp. ML290]
MYQLDTSIWIADGEAVPFFTLPYTTRMVVVRLADQSLWIHSPIKLTGALRSELASLGVVRYLIAPNQLHHLYLAEWVEAFPEAQLIGTQQVAKKRKDLRFDYHFEDLLEPAWQDDIAQCLITGSPVMTECVFFHRQSQTLIVTDLIENFRPEAFSPFKRKIAEWSGVTAPNGKTPLDWRLSFWFHKDELATHIRTLIHWAPQRLVMAHGEIIDEAVPHLLRAFSWLGKDKLTAPTD